MINTVKMLCILTPEDTHVRMQPKIVITLIDKLILELASNFFSCLMYASRLIAISKLNILSPHAPLEDFQNL